MKNNIIILNGPPGSGKDALAKWFVKMGYEHLSFKDEMFRLVFEITGISQEEWFKRYNNRPKKEQGWCRLNGMTQRECMIHLSENVVKPLLGKDHFGKVAATKVKEGCDYVFSDGGFPEEISKIAKDTGATHEVTIVRVFRGGCTFEGDSRKYIFEKDLSLGIAVKGFGVINYENKLFTTVSSIMQLVSEGYNEGSL